MGVSSEKDVNSKGSSRTAWAIAENGLGLGLLASARLCPFGAFRANSADCR